MSKKPTTLEDARAMFSQEVPPEPVKPVVNYEASFEVKNIEPGARSMFRNTVENLRIVTCPSGLVVEIKPLMANDKISIRDYLGPPPRAVIEILRHYCRVLHPGPYLPSTYSETIDWHEVKQIDFDAIMEVMKSIS